MLINDIIKSVFIAHQREVSMLKWTLNVNGLGRIKNASIKMNKVVIFSGENNSGKSYLMTLLYTICSTSFFKLFAEEKVTFSEDVSYWKDKILNNEGKEFKLSLEEKENLNKLLNEFLACKKEQLIRIAFNADINIEALSILLDKEADIILKISTNNTNLDGDTSELLLHCQTEGENSKVPNLVIRDRDATSAESIMLYIFDAIMGKNILHLNNDCMYLPTSRTGFMLTYDTLVQESLSNNFTLSTNENKNYLTKPSLDFLKFISTIKEKEDHSNSITEDIENNILDGKILVRNLPKVDIKYQPKNSKEQLPLHLTSGVVTETSALLLTLRYSGTKIVFMEEPEMCLHPQLQWEIAKVLSNLALQGFHIIFTTHSDIIFAYFSKIMAKKHLKDIGVYEFTADDIELLAIDTDDLPVTLFSKAITEILREVDSFDSFSFYNDIVRNESLI